MTFLFCGSSTVVNSTVLSPNPRPLTLQTQSIVPPPAARPLNTQVVNMAKSNAGLVPTNMLLVLPCGALFAPLHVNVSPRRKYGCK